MDVMLLPDGPWGPVNENELERYLRETVSVEAAALAYAWRMAAPARATRTMVMESIGHSLAMRFGMGCPLA